MLMFALVFMGGMLFEHFVFHKFHEKAKEMFIKLMGIF